MKKLLLLPLIFLPFTAFAGREITKTQLQALYTSNGTINGVIMSN